MTENNSTAESVMDNYFGIILGGFFTIAFTLLAYLGDKSNPVIIVLALVSLVLAILGWIIHSTTPLENRPL